VSDLPLHRPAEDLQAVRTPRAVELTWNLESGEAQTLVLEKSYDGTSFEEIHTVIAVRDEARRVSYSFSDFDVPAGGVAFYRLTQRFENGGVMRSRVIKLGLGLVEIPVSVELVGNSPNPFSASTEVVYRVLEPVHVKLTVWDISGHVVDQLVDETASPGLHRVPFAADGLPSGPYFVRMETDHSVQTLKMVLMK
jgi:hypothetical protein